MLRGAWYAAPDPARRADFERKYVATYGRPPQRLATLAYDARVAGRPARAAEAGRRLLGRGDRQPQRLVGRRRRVPLPARRPHRARAGGDRGPGRSRRRGQPGADHLRRASRPTDADPSARHPVRSRRHADPGLRAARRGVDAPAALLRRPSRRPRRGGDRAGAARHHGRSARLLERPRRSGQVAARHSRARGGCRCGAAWRGSATTTRRWPTTSPTPSPNCAAPSTGSIPTRTPRSMPCASAASSSRW